MRWSTRVGLQFPAPQDSISATTRAIPMVLWRNVGFENCQVVFDGISFTWRGNAVPQAIPKMGSAQETGVGRDFALIDARVAEGAYPRPWVALSINTDFVLHTDEHIPVHKNPDFAQ
jgi:hypothetical protein